MRRAWTERGGDIDALTAEAFEALSQRHDLAVVRIPETVPNDANLGCSVAGGYRASPPTLLVTESMSVRRQHFTLLHELGHHLQQTDIDLGGLVVDHASPKEFEDAACDAFAASVLVTDESLESVLRLHGLSAKGAVALFETTNASRAAISVRLAGKLTNAGVVAVLDPEGTVTFATSRGGMFPPARGSDQSANPLVEAALIEQGTGRVAQRDDARIHYSNGSTSNLLYGQAAWAGDSLLVVMVEYGASWLGMSPPRERTSTFATTRWEKCHECGLDYEIKVTCYACGSPRCPRGHCGCPSTKERTCECCFLVKQNAQFAPASKICLECAS